MKSLASLNSRPRCAACWGDGYVYNIFNGEREYCDACDATGYDLYYRPPEPTNHDKQIDAAIQKSKPIRPALRALQGAQTD
jgi:hypothetical protein